MKLADLLKIIFPPAAKKQPTKEQADILRHSAGPAWILAGPGSGKTEVLALFVLRLLYVDDDPCQKNRVLPESIVITTFTEKAARNLEDRIGMYRKRILEAMPELKSIDVSKLRIGTLHGLCNDILQEFRAPHYQNVRLMDEFEQAMFVFEQLSIINAPDFARDLPFWQAFAFLFDPYEWKPTYSYLPSKWIQASKLVVLLNRIVEDRVDVEAMKKGGAEWARLAALYEEYVSKLKAQHRADFSHLQSRFLEFLPSPVGKSFCEGDGNARPPISWVLVDEYQDTNLVQEAIYLTLANHGTRNIVVVGDDDQALYRFRGGSVECMITFDDACKAYFGNGSPAVTTFPLVGNFRSHPDIVKFCNEYITSFPAMASPGARAPGKQTMTAKSGIAGTYPAVGTLSGAKLDDVAVEFARTVKGLVDAKVVSDPSQCCLLLTSTRESPHNAEKYVDALRSAGLRPYNPRNKAFLEQEEVAALLGAIMTIVDPSGAEIPTRQKDLHTFIAACRTVYVTVAQNNLELSQYVQRCVRAIEKSADQYLNSNLQEIVYYVLGCAPFTSWMQDPMRRARLGKVTSLFESYSSMPVPDRPNVQRGRIKTSATVPATVLPAWARSFYYLFVGYLSRSGLDDVAEDEIICPPGYVPIMTIHQAKGLEFPFVFVGHMSKTATPGLTHELESAMSAFPGTPIRRFNRPSVTTRAELDLIRQFYVAYSRAEHALILMGNAAQLKSDGIPCGPSKGWLQKHAKPL